MTQADQILHYMKKNRAGITPLDALQECGCMRLAARIHEIKERGYSIVSIMCKRINSRGKTVRFMRYWVDGV